MAELFVSLWEEVRVSVYLMLEQQYRLFLRSSKGAEETGGFVVGKRGRVWEARNEEKMKELVENGCLL